LTADPRVVIAFDIACGSCHYCHSSEFSLCDNTNPNAHLADRLYGHGGAALFGFSHTFGGYAGGQAEYIRVPFIETNAIVIPDGVPDEKVLFISDILPTGYILADEIDPSFVITHRILISEGPETYKIFNDQKDDCIKAIIQMN